MPVLDGEPITFGESGPYGSAYSCSYRAVDETAGNTVITVSVLGTGYPREEWEQAEREEDVTEVDGIGDIAFFYPYDEAMDVLVEGVWLQAKLVGVHEAVTVEALSEICSRAIDRI
ncbi:MAG: hypothetical protein ABIR32_11705 [Ilumatobacteraceae bacterium]